MILTNPTDEELSDPRFEEAERVHDWRNHVGEATRKIWHSFTIEQRRAIFLDADQRASSEDWE